MNLTEIYYAMYDAAPLRKVHYCLNKITFY